MARVTVRGAVDRARHSSALHSPVGLWLEHNGAVLALMSLAVIGFSGGWRYGDLVLDGPGVAMYVDMALDNWQGFGVPYWLGEMWGGAPVWSFAPSLPVLKLLPLGSILGGEEAVKAMTLVAQIVGGWGTWILARSLWGRGSPALLAGFIYGLHPLFVTHAFFGHETSIWVMASTPWLVWSLRLALRGRGVRYVVGAGLIAGFAVLQQPEHVYALVVLCGALLVVELARARITGSGPTGWGGVLVRATVVVVIGLGVTAHWLVPFATMSEQFVLTPPAAAQSVLFEGVAADVGQEMGLFLRRSSELQGTAGFVGRNLLSGTLYLSWVAFALTLATIVLLPRRDRDGCLTAVLFAGAVGVWMSTAGIPLANSGPVARGQLLPFAAVGTLAGLLVGSLLRRLRLSRWLAALGTLATAGLLLLLPYATPFVALQKVVPFMASIRFPRLYHIAALAVALAAAYPLTLVRDWAMRRQPRSAAPLAGAAALAVAGLFVVDIWPYRSYYEAQAPHRDDAYALAERRLDSFGGAGRVATENFGDPAAVGYLLAQDQEVSSGWPHALASASAWQVTGEAFLAPRGLSDAAFGLSATTHRAAEVYAFPGNDESLVSEVALRLNTRAMPLVRTYDQALVLADEEISPLLATSLAQRNIGVVNAGAATAAELGNRARAFLGDDDACAGAGDIPVQEVARQLATSCSLERWVGVFTGSSQRKVDERPGALFTPPLDGLAGISVWLDNPPGPTRLVVYELADDPGAPGIEVARTTAGGLDDNGLYHFSFPPLEASAGRRYAFELVCEDCDVNPGMVVTGTERSEANLIVDRERIPGRVAAFSLAYHELETVAPSDVDIDARRPATGRWEIATSGDQDSVLVVAEAWFPGWKAWLDGEEVEVLKADGAFLGVALPAGDHQVRLAYQLPTATKVGRFVTLVTLGISAVLLWAPRRIRRRYQAISPPAPRRREPGPPARRGPPTGSSSREGGARRG